MRKVAYACVLPLALLAAGCQKKPVLAAKVVAVYAPIQVLRSSIRLEQQQQTGMPLPDGSIFVVVATNISNPTRHAQNLDQDGVALVDEFSNRFTRVGVTVECSDTPSVLEYDGKLGDLELEPGQSLAGDPRSSCFVFAVPATDRRLALSIPGAPDTPMPMPPRKINVSTPTSDATAGAS